MAVTGPIADAARGHLPLTWDALSKSQQFGDGLLADKVDLVKEMLFGSVIPPNQEDTYPLRALDYAGKLVALELIVPGMDLWMNEPTYESATGVSENHTFVDRAEKLRLLGQRLAYEVGRDEAIIYGLLGRPRLRVLPRMGISTPADDVLLTPDPRGFPAPYRTGVTGQRLT